MILDAIECEAFAYLGPMWGPGQQILDVGAGSGEVAEYLENKYGVQITAIDVLPPSKNYYGTPKIACACSSTPAEPPSSANPGIQRAPPPRTNAQIICDSRGFGSQRELAFKFGLIFFGKKLFTY